MTSNLSRTTEHLTKQMSDKKTLTGEEVRKIVHKEVTDVMGNRNNHSHTPQPDNKTVATQQIVKNFIQAGKFNDAFQTALSSSDLSMVIYTCENVNTTQVFNQSSCPSSNNCPSISRTRLRSNTRISTRLSPILIQ